MRPLLASTSPVCLAALTLVLACSPAGNGKRGGDNPNDGRAGSGSEGDGKAGGSNLPTDPDLMCDPELPGSPCGPDAVAPLGCGDGMLAEDEACDDANTSSDDGCQSNCLAVDPGYSCHPAGEPCHELVLCGDEIVGSSEQCDDGNKKGGDGCSPSCHFETGYKCEGSPSTCTRTVCGDGDKEGAESCDDGNDEPFDGCSSVCQTEPSCDGDACTSECGDGMMIDEECDDGNDKDGDGCSSTCQEEEGFTCSQDAAAECEKINDECILRVPALFRDFNAVDSPGGHPDFQVKCKTGKEFEVVTTGLVKPDLGTDGKPQLAADGFSCVAEDQTKKVALIANAASFEQWYTASDKSKAIVGDIVLFKKAMGGFVNRWGAMGEQWTSGTNGSQVSYDGTPFFFPLDDHPEALMDERTEAKAAPDYGFDWTWEKDLVPGAGTHNFHFTTEVKYWFQYDASASATLDFTGDDDVWVFVNGKLAVDLGGVHPPKNGSVTIAAASAKTYGLSDGKVYAISIFHAERKQEGSSFRLTLDGFDTARSSCTPICGDGIVSLGEQCDDGVNDGGYGECAEDCVIGEYCGDGIEQPVEDCDDGNRIDGDGCGSACRNVDVK